MENNNKKVGFSRRLLAYYIDFAILLIPLVGAIYFIAISTNSIIQLFVNSLQMIAIIILPNIFFGIFYYVVLQHSFGATFGQMFAGFQILDKDGKKLSLQKLFFRQTVGKMASASLFGLGYYSIIKNPQKQAWHDEMVGSFPISKRDSWPFAIMVLAFIISLNVYLVYSSVVAFAQNDSLRYDIKSTVTKFQTIMAPTPKSKNQPNQKFNLLMDETQQNYYKGDFNKQMELSQTAFNSATTDQEKAEALYWRGLAKYKLATGTDKSAAQADMNESLKLYPENAGPYVTLSAIESDYGNYQTALILAQKCAQIEPKYAWCHNNIGLSLLLLGKKEEGISELEKAVSLAPDSIVFQDNLRRARLGR